MKMMDTRAYVGMLKELVEQGREVRMVISGSSMAPFLIHGRDSIFFRAPERELRKGDIVFYERPGGQFVVHRICRVHADGYDIIGGCTDGNRASCATEADLCTGDKSGTKRKNTCTGNVLVGVFCTGLDSHHPASPDSDAWICPVIRCG